MQLNEVGLGDDLGDKGDDKVDDAVFGLARRMPVDLRRKGVSIVLGDR
jgi:hypothetical protein